MDRKGQEGALHRSETSSATAGRASAAHIEDYFIRSNVDFTAASDWLGGMSHSLRTTKRYVDAAASRGRRMNSRHHTTAIHDATM